MNNWIHIRSGYGIYEKLFSRACRICYLGNSVTVQKEGYRSILHNEIVRISGYEHESVNAALGGVGSLGSCFLIPQLVLRRKPDICFVECTTADIGGATPLSQIGCSVEGIIRQLLSGNIEVGIFHLYRDRDEYYNSDKVIYIYESLADRYQIPSFNIDAAIWKNISKNQYASSEITYDGIHTTSKGATVTASLLAEGLGHLKGSLKRTNEIPTPHLDAYEFPGIIIAALDMVAKKEECKVGRFRFFLPFIEIFAGNSINFSAVNGDLIALLVIADKDSGVIELHNDGVTTVQLYDKWCDKERMQVIILDKTLADSELKVSLSDLEAAPRGANMTPNGEIKKGTSLKLIGFMVNHFTKNNEKPAAW